VSTQPRVVMELSVVCVVLPACGGVRTDSDVTGTVTLMSECLQYSCPEVICHMVALF
jgi:hypothetical protein